MNIIQRGNPGIMKSIQEKAKTISENNGVANLGAMPNSRPVEVVPQGGAYASMMKNRVDEDKVINSRKTSSVGYVSPVVEQSGSKTDKRLLSRLLESVETLPYNKEFFNATSSLFTLYSMGELSEGVLKTLSREDLKEVRGILREFKEVIDNF